MSTKEWLKDRTRFRTLETNEKLELLVTHANELNHELAHLRLLNWVFVCLFLGAVVWHVLS